MSIATLWERVKTSYQFLACRGLPWAGPQISGGAQSPFSAIRQAWAQWSGKFWTSLFSCWLLEDEGGVREKGGLTLGERAKPEWLGMVFILPLVNRKHFSISVMSWFTAGLFLLLGYTFALQRGTAKLGRPDRAALRPSQNHQVF